MEDGEDGGPGGAVEASAPGGRSAGRPVRWVPPVSPAGPGATGGHQASGARPQPVPDVEYPQGELYVQRALG
ncbi:hypothetical protein GCM10009716_20900 [Streptomyces sodiiphilus]|uniref:Uncharacterized protein n=1 Tax=Streptomyces sodiiphilus TaxID=226217 RepID=A0ABP5AE78_9ACTN